MHNSVSISIIIVNYNLTQSIRILLESIQKYTSGLSYEVIVVDNNSPDRSIEKLADEFPDFQFNFLNTNYGFGHANNIGFAKSRGEYLLLLNPDTYLVNNLPFNLYKIAKDNTEFGIIGPKLIYPNGDFQISTGKFPNFLSEIGGISGLNIPLLRIVNFVKFHLLRKEFYYVDFIFGSCMMIRSDLFNKLKGFDEDYFLFTEEVDLCYRTRKYTDFKIVYYFNEKIVHIKSLITGNDLPRRMKLGYTSKLKFYIKHYPAYKIYLQKFAVISMFFLRYIFSFRKKNKNTNYRKAYLDIINHYLNN